MAKSESDSDFEEPDACSTQVLPTIQAKMRISKGPKSNSLAKNLKLHKVNKNDDESTFSGSNTQKSLKSYNGGASESGSESSGAETKPKKSPAVTKKIKVVNSTNNNIGSSSSSNVSEKDSTSSSSGNDEKQDLKRPATNAKQQSSSSDSESSSSSSEDDVAKTKREQIMKILQMKLKEQSKSAKKGATSAKVIKQKKRKSSSSPSDSDDSKIENALKTNSEHKENTSSSATSDSDEEIQKVPIKNKLKKTSSLHSSSSAKETRKELPIKVQKAKKQSSSSEENEETEPNRNVTSQGRCGTVSSSSSDSEFDLNRTESQAVFSRKFSEGKNEHLNYYLKCHNLHLVDVNSGKFTLDEISSDDEVFSMKVSKNIPPQLLAHAKFSLDKEKTITVGESKLSVKVDKTDAEQINLLGVAKDKKDENKEFVINVLKSSGCIRINEEYELPAKSPLKQQETSNKVPFPHDKIKERHPLFGHDYQKHINLAPDVSRRLDALIEELNEKYDSMSSSPNSTRKSKKSKNKELETPKQSLVDLPKLETIKKEKKQKKNKSEINVDSILDSFQLEESNVEDLLFQDKSKKQKKRKRDEPDLPLPIIKQEPNVSGESKKLKSKKQVESVIVKQEILSPEPPKKKKKKHKQDEVPVPLPIPETIDRKPKFKAINSIINSTMMSPSVGKARFDANESLIKPERIDEQFAKPKKHKKRHSESINEADEISVKKVKKRRPTVV